MKIILTFLLLMQSTHSKYQDLILGNWNLCTNEINDPYFESLAFHKNGILELSYRGDTVFTKGYQINKKIMILNKQDSCKVIKISADSLILSSLLQKKCIQRYCRAKFQNIW